MMPGPTAGLRWACLAGCVPALTLGVVIGGPVAPGFGLVAVLLLYPLAEELVFRGGVQEWLLRRLPGSGRWLTPANALTSLLFGAAHALTRGLAVGAGVLLPSLLLGLLYERSRSLAWCIGIHAAWNAAYQLGAHLAAAHVS